MEISKNTHDVMKGSKWNPATLSDTDKRRRHPLTGQMFLSLGHSWNSFYSIGFC